MNPTRSLINEKAQFCNCYMLDSEKGITNILIKLKMDTFYVSAVIPSWRAHADSRLREREGHTVLITFLLMPPIVEEIPILCLDPVCLCSTLAVSKYLFIYLRLVKGLTKESPLVPSTDLNHKGCHQLS